MSFNDQHGLETYKSLIAISTQGFKALQLVNGGAIVALLAYLGQVPERAALAVHIRCSVTCFVVGLLAGTAAFIPSYFTQLALYNETVHPREYKGVRHETWIGVALVVSLVSLACFAAGAFAAVGVLAANPGA